MKKLISMILLLSLVFSLMTGISVSAFAAEDADEITEITADIEAILANVEDAVAETEEAPAEEPEETPAEDIEEVPALDIIETLVEDVETAVAEVSVEAPVLHGASWTKADGLVSGQTYVIGVENGDGSLSVLKNDGGNVVVASIASAADAAPEMIWTATEASRGYLIQNGETCLYYKDSSGTWATTDTSKANWSYNGTLFYVGSGESYVVISDGAMSITKTASEASAIVIYTTGSAGESAPVESPWSEDTALTTGKTYAIGIKNDDGSVTVLKDNGGAVVAAKLASIDEADESMQWLYSDGLQNVATTADYLYYNDPYIRDSAAKNWAYADGIMSYDSKGTAYYLTVTADAASCGTDSAAASTDIVLWSMGEGTSDSGDSDSTESSDGFNQTDKIAGLGSGSTSALFVDANGYPLFISDNGVPSCDSMALTMTGEAGSYNIATDKPNIIWTVSEGSPPYLQLAMDDKGTIKYLYIDDDGVVQSSTEAGYAFWNNGDGVNLSYKSAGGTTYYIATMTADGITTTTDESSALLIYTLIGTSTGGSGGGGGTEVDAEAPVITKQPEAIPFVHEGSGYAAPTLTIAAQLAEGVTANNLYFQWYVEGKAVGEATKIAVNEDGSPVETSITLDSLKDQPVGVYNIYCEVTCNVKDAETGEPTAHTATSTNVAFTVCKGVLHNSFLTFSDVHETFANVGSAIGDCITVNNGLVPALIICTGDWANGHFSGGDETSENYATTMSDYIAKLYAQVSGIDIIFLSGNHDNGAAAADATINAGLGAAEDYDGIGVMYDSKTETDGTSKENDGLVVFGINYESLETASGFSYDAVLPELEAFLKDLEKDYNGELVIISAHAGLHQLADWGGGDKYNVDKSNEMVALLNEYADTMDIMYFFGHDHSKGEAEIFYKPGDSITSTVSYNNQTTETQTIGFSYGHAGYITNTIGGQERYSLVTWDGDSITRSMSVVNGNEVAELTYSLTRVAEEPEIEVQVKITGANSGFMLVDENFKPIDNVIHKNGDTINASGTIIIQLMDAAQLDSASKNVEVIVVDGVTYLKLLSPTADTKVDVNVALKTPDNDNDKPSTGETAPKTGDDANIVLWIAVLILCAGSLVILPRKKHN